MADEVLVEDMYRFEDLLAPEEAEVLLRVRGFLEHEVAPHADEWWGKAAFPHHLIARFAELDIAGLAYEECGGGKARSMLTGFIALEMARVDASMATFYGVHAGLAMGSIARCGSPEQRRRWLPAMGRMEQIGAFALTEPLSGSDVAAGLHTTARRDGDAWIINGAKRWIGNATFADLTVVWARDEATDKVLGFVVPAGAPGFTATKIEHKLALRTIENADIVLEDCRVPEADRLQDAEGFQDTAEVLRHTRGGVAWEAVGVMLGAYRIALDYTLGREQFGGPVARFQMVQDTLVRMLGNATACLGMAVRLAQLEDAGAFRDEQSALAKAYCTTRMRETVAWGRELLAGNGIVLDYGIGRFVADAEALYSYEGTRDINTLIAGRAVTGIGAFV
ncbi:MAG TPA: acyl-CoA dehydrogenase family protein [Actinocrinis sp.]|jgi:glutaryl-CoA dehydrogenase